MVRDHCRHQSYVGCPRQLRFPLVGRGTPPRPRCAAPGCGHAPRNRVVP